MNQQQQILFAIFFTSIDQDVHVNKQLDFIYTASIAQLVERPLSEREVVGSNPAASPYQRC